MDFPRHQQLTNIKPKLYAQFSHGRAYSRTRSRNTWFILWVPYLCACSLRSPHPPNPIRLRHPQGVPLVFPAGSLGRCLRFLTRALRALVTALAPAFRRPTAAVAPALARWGIFGTRSSSRPPCGRSLIFRVNLGYAIPKGFPNLSYARSQARFMQCPTHARKLASCSQSSQHSPNL